MTIKQQGGIFGRNPTFNDVTVDDTLTAATQVNTPILVNGVASGTLTIGAGAAQNTGANILMYGESHPQVSDFLFRSGTTGLVRIQDSGEVKILNGNLRFDTAGTGIDFSATSGTGTSELFDDYEEGSFTASLKVGGTTLYSTTSTRYTKVGHLVYYNIDFTTNSYPGVGANTGNVTVGGLPYAATNTVGRAVVSNVLQVSSPFTANLQDIGTNINATSSEITFYSTTGTTSSTLTHTALSASASSSTYLRLSGVYTAA